MRDDPLKNLAVVQAVRDIPQLYERETGIPKQELDRLWNIVGSKVDLPGVAARDRWRIIRGSFVRYLRTKDTDEAPKKEYYLAKYMEFVKPFLKLRDSSGPNHSTTTTTYRTFCIDETGTVKPQPESPTPSSAKKGLRSNASAKKRRCDSPVVYENVVLKGETNYQAEEEIDEEEEEMVFDLGETGNYTLRNGNLVPNSTSTAVVEQQQLHQPHPVPDEDSNPDLMFFKSLLPDMQALSNKQKSKFKVLVISALTDMLED